MDNSYRFSISTAEVTYHFDLTPSKEGSLVIGNERYTEER